MKFKKFVENDICWSADVKANIKQQEIKNLAVVSYQFLQEVPLKLEIKCKKGVHFSFVLVGIPFTLILSVKNMGEGCLTDKIS